MAACCRQVPAASTELAASERLVRTASLVDAAPGERILEGGSGHGVLVGLLAHRGAEVVCVYRSSGMTAAAARRSAAEVAAGRVQLVTAPLVEAPLDGHFDVVVAFDVRAIFADDGAGSQMATTRQRGCRLHRRPHRRHLTVRPDPTPSGGPAVPAALKCPAPRADHPVR